MKLEYKDQTGGKAKISGRVWARMFRDAALRFQGFGHIPMFPTPNISVPRSIGKMLLSAVFSSVLFIGPLEAATGNVVFNGNITNNNLCAINIQQSGTLGVATNLRQLSSKISGGVAGIATVTGLGFFNISAVTAPIFAVGPLGANTGVTRQVRYSGVNLLGGGATFAEKSGTLLTPITLLSQTRVTMHYIADRPTPFPDGHYEALVVLRCE